MRVWCHSALKDLNPGRVQVSLSISLVYLPVMPLVRYIADITPTEKAMLTDRNWPLVSLLVFTCAAAEQPKSCPGDKEGKGSERTSADLHCIYTVCIRQEESEGSLHGKISDGKKIDTKPKSKVHSDCLIIYRWKKNLSEVEVTFFFLNVIISVPYELWPLIYMTIGTIWLRRKQVNTHMQQDDSFWAFSHYIFCYIKDLLKPRVTLKRVMQTNECKCLRHLRYLYW